ncbi:MAG: YlmC/YmxH family sporulation protein [Candidatus Paraimprobicoccus trichonymphae]|uniref:YlmC/YmxH family sporulation protein n=1 Tax=Candidatus Paraimprobicoccus trichonymphae TaxID=3033793 RepID=A0AA48HZ18_9FIRM|nr:MAG: YlmC/YmxH family sporulation protein [Candidatus Paraimprobicoccus trichonymphae]
MLCRIVDMKNKEVINIKDGSRIGCVNDVELDILYAKLVAIVIQGKLKFFGLFGRGDDIIIDWKDIRVIGDDTILVNYNPIFKKRKKTNFFKNIFKN